MTPWPLPTIKRQVAESRPWMCHACRHVLAARCIVHHDLVYHELAAQVLDSLAEKEKET